MSSAIARYADRFHRAGGSGHQIASPLGAWLLIALAAPAAGKAARAELAGVLGMDVPDAAHLARTLLEQPHPLVAAAAAAWTDPRYDSDDLRAWTAGLPAAVQRGAIPAQTAADAWARERTRGLIDRFPVEITPQTVLVLASALATTVSWLVPFDVAAGADLRSSAWPHLARVLRTPGDSGRAHRCSIVHSRGAGQVAVHVARAADGLAVTSVIASAAVRPAEVLAAAHEIALGADAHTVSLFDLPLGEAELWTITERTAELTRERDERCRAVLPAWSAESSHDLTRAAELGFPAAADALIALLPPGDYRWQAVQSAMARYSREGFEAAAVTALGMRALAYREPRQGLLREAELRFAHPYAVVAAVDDDASPWHGVPVFSAWVAEPTDAG